MSEKAIKPGGKMAWLILIVLALLYASDFAVRLVYSVSMEAIKAEFNFSDTQIGMLQSFFFIGLGAFTIPVAIMVDRFHRKKVIAAMSFLWNGATLLTGMSTNFATMLASRFAVGVGVAGYAPGGIGWVSEIFPKEKRASAIGIYAMGMVMGCLIGMGVGGAIISETGDWRMAYYAIGIPGIILTLFVLILPDPRKTQVAPTAGSNIFKEMGSFFKIKTYRLISVATGFYLVISVAGQTWSVVLLMRAYSLNAVEAGGIMAALILPGLLAPILGGQIADRMQAKIPHGRPLFCVICGMLGIGFYVVQYASAGIIPLWGYVTLMVFASLLSSMPIPVYNTVIQDVIPADKRSTGQAIVIFIQYSVFTWWGATLVGTISDLLGGGTFGLKMALLAVCPISMVALLLFYRACRYYPEESSQQAVACEKG